MRDDSTESTEEKARSMTDCCLT